MAPNNVPSAQAFQTKSKPSEIRASNIEAGKGMNFFSWISKFLFLRLILIWLTISIKLLPMQSEQVWALEEWTKWYCLSSQDFFFM